MPGAPRNAWGVWGAPDPIKPWEHGAPKLNSDKGGTVRPEFADTLQWFYGRALNPKDKEHCVRLLAQIHLKQEEDSKKSNLAVRGHSFEKPQTPSQRPLSATNPTKAKFATKIKETRPRSAIPSPSRGAEDETKTSYQLQKESIERLSRPKSTKPTVQFQQKFRPRSAMASVGTRKSFDPYLTTHEREYHGYPSGLYAEATRPMSASNGFTYSYDLSGEIGNTTATKEFGWKKGQKAEPIRTGTSSGNRRNNPHPHESFMVWKLAKESTNGMVTKPSPHLQYRSLTKDVLGEIISEQLKSTYQSDFMGIPQGYQMKTAIDAPPDWKARMHRTLNTTERRTFKKPEQTKELVGNVTRYGCNTKKGLSAYGVVPTVTASHVRNQEVVKGRTTYDVQFRDRYEQPDLEKLLQNQPNKKAYERFMKYARSEMKNRCGDGRRRSAGGEKVPSWVTKWEGPHHHEHQ